MTVLGDRVIELSTTHSAKQIAEILGCSIPAVRRWLKPEKYYNKKTMEQKRKYKSKMVDAARVFVDEFKLKRGCCDCGLRDDQTSLFDCLNSGDKKVRISRMVTDGYRIEKIAKELDECVVVCANCSRIRRNADVGYLNIKFKFVKQYKLESSCTDCGISNYKVLDFHHTNTENKEINIGAMIRNKEYNLDDIVNELSKCIPLCAICHRKRHL